MPGPDPYPAFAAVPALIAGREAVRPKTPPPYTSPPQPSPRLTAPPRPALAAPSPPPVPASIPNRSFSIRLRLMIALAVTLLLVTGAFALFTIQLTNASQDELTDATLTAQAQMLREVLARKGDAAIVATERLATAPALVDAVARQNSAATGVLLAEFLAQQPGLVHLAVVDAQERLLGDLRPGSGPNPPDTGLTRFLDRGRPVAGVERGLQGTFTLRAVVPIAGPAGSPPIGALLTDSSLNDMLVALETATGAGIVLLDSRNQPAMTGHSMAKPDIRGIVDDFASAGGTGLHTVQSGGHTFAVGAVPLLASAGARLGTELEIRDVTDSSGQRRFVTIVATQLLVLVLIMVPLALIYVSNRTFRPLGSLVAGIHALTHGDTEIELEGEDRRDEIGAIARSLSVLRDRSRELARQRLRQERGRRRQHRFIRQQLTEMGAAFGTDGRADLEADTQNIEDALAKLESDQASTDSHELGVLALAFRITAKRVIAQYGRMDTLVGQLRDALQERTELIGLQQQIEIATGMQADLLPQALPPRPDVQARGGLLPAKEFGGDFYDFFPLGPGQIAIVAGNAGGTGLQSAFLTLTARTLLKAVLMCGVAPGAAMTRVNALLAAEKGATGGVAAIVLMLDIAGSRITGCNAGFPAPLLLRRLGEAAAIELPDGPFLGQHPMAEFAEGRIDLPPRTTLVVHSPGLGGGNEGRLQAALESCMDPGAEAVLNAMMSAAAQRRDEKRDASCVVLRYAAVMQRTASDQSGGL